MAVPRYGFGDVLVGVNHHVHAMLTGKANHSAQPRSAKCGCYLPQTCSSSASNAHPGERQARRRGSLAQSHAPSATVIGLPEMTDQFLEVLGRSRLRDEDKSAISQSLDVFLGDE